MVSKQILYKVSRLKAEVQMLAHIESNHVEADQSRPRIRPTVIQLVHLGYSIGLPAVQLDGGQPPLGVVDADRAAATG